MDLSTLQSEIEGGGNKRGGEGVGKKSESK